MINIENSQILYKSLSRPMKDILAKNHLIS